MRREREGGRETLTCHCFHSVVKAPLSWCCCCCCTVTCGHHTRTHTQSYRKTRVRCAQCFCVTVCVWSSTFQRFAFLPAVEIVHTPPPSLSLTLSLSARTLLAHARSSSSGSSTEGAINTLKARRGFKPERRTGGDSAGIMKVTEQQRGVPVWLLFARLRGARVHVCARPF